ncbi:MAG: head GIN domain-containing protein [Bacteroidales bacterium]
MKRFFIFGGILIFLMILFSSCERWRCIEGNDLVRLETRDDISGFTGLVSEGDFSLQITQDTVFEISIRADENILPYIRTEVRGRKLYIDYNTDRCVRTSRTIEIDVKMEEVEDIVLRGSGEIYCNNLFTNDINVLLEGSGEIELFGLDALFVNATITGSGKIELVGDAEDTDMAIIGSGQIRADELRHFESYIEISGSGDVLVWALDEIRGEISGSGIIWYKVFPLRGYRVDITGSGDVKPL